MAFLQFDSKSSAEPENQTFSPDGFDDSDSLDTASIFDLSTPTSERKSSIATDSSVFFPSPNPGNPWGDFAPVSATAANGQQMASHYSEPVLMSNNPFLHHHSNWMVYDHTPDSKTPVAPATYQPYVETAETGTYEHASDVETPVASAVYEPYVEAAEAGPLSRPPSANEGYFNNPFASSGNQIIGNDAQSGPVMPPTPDGVVPTPMELAEQETGGGRSNHHLQDPPSRTLSPVSLLRRDGVRKKNHKQEIPLGRSLLTIDHLIAESTNDDEIKELKQQKRLLRNRQAALDSRQRKKKHTEELEEEKKSWLEQRDMFHQEINELQQQLQSLHMHNEQLGMENNELSQQIQNMQSEKEDIIIAHTLETQNLRRKIIILTEEIRRPAQPAPDYSEFDPASLREDWNRYIAVDDEDERLDPMDQTISQPQETTLVIGQPRKAAQSEISESSVGPASALVLLLLYGAFVAATSSSSLNLPPVPDQCRAEAGKILQELDVMHDEPSAQAMQILNVAQPSFSTIPTVSSWMQPDGNKALPSQMFFPAANPAVAPSSLDLLTTQLMTPSREQEIEEAFSLTPAQYKSLTTHDFPPAQDEDEDENADESSRTPVPHSFFNIQNTIQQLRKDSNDGQVSDIYKRSLMWERVPPDVLREFRRMVRENPMDMKTEAHDD